MYLLPVAAAAFPRLETFLAGGSLGLDSTVSSDFSVLASLFSLLLPPFLLKEIKRKYNF